jgi:hypothetical protein
MTVPEGMFVPVTTCQGAIVPVTDEAVSVVCPKEIAPVNDAELIAETVIDVVPVLVAVKTGFAPPPAPTTSIEFPKVAKAPH